MTSICASSILACGMRVTLLEDNGFTSDAPENYLTSSGLVELQITPVISEGSDRERKSGCDCIIASAKFPDLLKRFNFAISHGQLDPSMMALMLGTQLIEDVDGNAIGFDWPDSGTSCEATPPPKVALEVWSWVWENDQQDESLPYWHWVWPMSRWQVAPFALNADFANVALAGYSQANAMWGQGPFGDDPGHNIGALGSVWQTATPPPAAVCGLQGITPAS